MAIGEIANISYFITLERPEDRGFDQTLCERSGFADVTTAGVLLHFFTQAARDCDSPSCEKSVTATLWDASPSSKR